MMTPASRTAVAALLVGAAGPCSAGRPLVTEDAAVLEPGACELESFASHGREGNAASSRGASLQWGCGFGLGSQAALAVAQRRRDGQDSRTLVLAGKTGLVAQPAGNAWTLAWGLGGEQRGGDGMRHESTYVNGVLSRPLAGPTRLHVNLGWSHSAQRRASTSTWALAVEHAGAAGIDWMGEMFASDRDRSPWLQAGARWAWQPDKVFIDASIGIQATAARPTVATLGLKLVF